jgi:hypothetical protein
VQAALNIALTVKSAQEQHKLLKRLYENYEQEKKMEDRANALFPSMKVKENNGYKNKDENIKDNNFIKYNPYYKPIHDTYRKILIDANTYAGKENIDGYKPFYTDANPKTGYYGRAYINQKTKTIIIAYKGSDPVSKKDWIDNNLSMKVLNKTPKQFSDAEKFYYDVRNKLGNNIKNYKINFVGYSMGGTLAELMGAKYGNETVTFNSYGAAQINDAVIKYTDNIINYGNTDDFVFNMKNTTHVGKNIYTKPQTLKKQNCIKNHTLEYMGDLQKIPSQ